MLRQSKYLPSYVPFDEFKKDVLLFTNGRKVKKTIDRYPIKLRSAMLAELEAYQIRAFVLATR